MATLIDANQAMFTPFEPKLKNRFVMSIDGIPGYHESVTGRDGYSDFYKKDIDIQVLGPVGDVVETWKLKGAFITAANFGDLDFSSSEPVEISVTIRMDFCILEF